MKKNFLIVLLSLISVLGAYPQSNSNNGQNYINKSKAALDRKDYDESMRWAQRYINEYHSYAPLASIAEQMYIDAKNIYPNDKKGFVKPLEYAGSLGHSDALYLLGMQYYAGQFIPKDIVKGMALLKASEKLGNSKAATTYRTLANGADWIAHNAKMKKYNDMIIGAVGLVALAAVASKIIGNLPPSSSSYSSSSSYTSSSSSYNSSSSSTSSSTNNNQATSSNNTSSDKQHTCKVKIKYETIKGEYRNLIQSNIEVRFHRDRFTQGGGYEKFWVDTNGNCTITWSDNIGDAIDRISFTENGHGYCIKDIMLKPDGTYTLHAPWKW